MVKGLRASAAALRVKRPVAVPDTRVVDVGANCNQTVSRFVPVLRVTTCLRAIEEPTVLLVDDVIVPV